MSALPTDPRNKLERPCIAARNPAERAAKGARQSLAGLHGQLGKAQLSSTVGGKHHAYF